MVWYLAPRRTEKLGTRMKMKGEGWAKVAPVEVSQPVAVAVSTSED